MLKKRISAVLGALIMLAACAGVFAGCGEKDPYAAIDKSNIYGMDEPVLEVFSLIPNEDGSYNHTVEGFSMQITADLMGAMGVKSMRFRIPSGFMTTAGLYDEDAYAYLKNAITLLKEAGVELLIGLLDYFPTDTGFTPDSSRSAPKQDDEYYEDWMQSVYGLYHETCKLFPEITYWEMGNEMNSDNFFHPNGYISESGSLQAGSGGFSWDEHVEIYTDYMYNAAKGIHDANAGNKAVMSGLAFTTTGSYASIQYYLEDVYDLIQGGGAPTYLGESERSSDVRDYFDALCWHPYVSQKKLDEGWLEGNNQIYQAAIDHGDEGIPVFFTEFGFHDDGDEELEQLQIGYMEQAYEYMINDMPYVMACCAFRLYQCQYATTWGGAYQIYWGYFSEPVNGGDGFAPRAKAYALQKLYGGTGDIEKYAHVYAQK